MRLTESKGLVILLMVSTLAITAGTWFVTQKDQNSPMQQSKVSSQPDQSTPFLTQHENARTPNTNTFKGAHFSIEYPKEWEKLVGAEETYSPDTIEGINLRISSNSVFAVLAKSSDYIQALGEAKAAKALGDLNFAEVIIAHHQAVRLDYSGGKQFTFPTTDIYVRGSGEIAYYLIHFNGPRSEISDSMINNLLSSINFRN